MSAGHGSHGLRSINAIRNCAGLTDLTPGLFASVFKDSVDAEHSWEFSGLSFWIRC